MTLQERTRSTLKDVYAILDRAGWTEPLSSAGDSESLDRVVADLHQLESEGNLVVLRRSGDSVYIEAASPGNDVPSMETANDVVEVLSGRETSNADPAVPASTAAVIAAGIFAMGRVGKIIVLPKDVRSPLP